MSEQEFQTKVLHQLGRLNTTILGDEEAGIEGMAHKVNKHQKHLDDLIPVVADTFALCGNHESYITSAKKWIDRAKWTWAGILIIGTPVTIILCNITLRYLGFK